MTLCSVFIIAASLSRFTGQQFSLETTRLSWWRHQMETFSALMAICAGNSPVPGEYPAQWPVTQSFDVFSDLRPNKRLSKQWWGWWFETLSSPLWRHCNVENCRKYASKQGKPLKFLLDRNPKMLPRYTLRWNTRVKAGIHHELDTCIVHVSGS